MGKKRSPEYLAKKEEQRRKNRFYQILRAHTEALKEEAWRQDWRELGFTDAEISAFFWMGFYSADNDEFDNSEFATSAYADYETWFTDSWIRD